MADDLRTIAERVGNRRGQDGVDLDILVQFAVDILEANEHAEHLHDLQVKADAAIERASRER